MPFFARPLDQLISESLEELAANTNITRLSPGSKARSLLEILNTRLEEAYDIFDINLARAFVSSAPGQFLDLIGEIVSVSREGAVSAFVGSDTQVPLEVLMAAQTFF